MLCLITRLKMPSVWMTLVARVGFRLMRRHATRVDGLIDSRLLVAGRTLYFVSIWTGRDAILRFNSSVREHPAWVRWARESGGDIWSGYFEYIGGQPRGFPWPDTLEESLRPLEPVC